MLVSFYAILTGNAYKMFNKMEAVGKRSKQMPVINCDLHCMPVLNSNSLVIICQTGMLKASGGVGIIGSFPFFVVFNNKVVPSLSR